MRALVLILTLLLPLTVRAGELNNLILLALKNSKEIEKAKADYRISDLLYREAVSSCFPTVNLFYRRTELTDVPTYSFSLPGLPPATFSLFNSSYYQFGVKLSQPLFTGGQITFSVKLREKQKKATYYLFKETVNRVVLTVKKDYYNLLKAKASVETARAYLKAAKRHYRDVKAFFDEGIVPRRDLLEAEVKLRDAEEKLTYAKSIYRVALEKLKTDIGVPDLNFTPNGELHYRPVKLNLEELLKTAYSTRPLLKYAYMVKRAADEGVKLSASAFSPKLFMGIDYQKTDQYPGETYSSTAVSFTLNFPLFEGGKRFFEVERAREERRKAEISLKDLKDRVRLQVVSAYTELLSAAARVKTAQSQVKEAKELLRDSKERYREHVGTSTEVVDAIAYLYSAMNSLNSALADYNTALSELEFAVGKPLLRGER